MCANKSRANRSWWKPLMSQLLTAGSPNAVCLRLLGKSLWLANKLWFQNPTLRIKNFFFFFFLEIVEFLFLKFCIWMFNKLCFLIIIFTITNAFHLYIHLESTIHFTCRFGLYITGWNYLEIHFVICKVTTTTVKQQQWYGVMCHILLYCAAILQ